MSRLDEADQKAQKLVRSDELVKAKVAQYRYPMQELQLAYSQTKGKIYTEEEDRYLLCRLAHYGLNSDDVYEKIKKDISDFPVFRFDWFLRSRTPIELNRRCTTLIGLITKEFNGQGEDDEDEEMEEQPKPKAATRGKVRHPSLHCVYCSANSTPVLFSETHSGRRRRSRIPVIDASVWYHSWEAIAQEEKGLV